MDISKVYHQSPTPDETPLLIEQNLSEFAQALGEINDANKTKGYMMAKKRCPEECSDAFKLVFLRCEVFNIDRAVQRWLKYWDTRIKVFGEEKAFLPIDALDDATEEDKAALQMDYLQVADETDPDGRAILFFDFSKESCGIPSDSLLRAVWYQVHVALRKDSVQKHGVVVFTKTINKLSDWRPSLSKKIALAGKGVLPVRFAGMHYVNPPTLITVVMPIIRSVVGKKLRHRFYTHSGSTDEVLESLSRFGLGTKERLPVMFGGNLDFQ
jgi:hypothetical protein